MIIPEAGLVILEDARVDRGDDLVGVVGVERVEANVRMRKAELRVLIGLERAEHRAVLHVVAVDDQIIRGANVALLF